MDVWNIFAKAFIAATAKKAVDEIAGLLSRLRTKADSVTTKEEIQELKVEIENLATGLDQVREEIGKEIQKVLAPSLEKILALARVKAVLEYAHGVCREELSEKARGDLRIEMQKPHVTEALQILSEPLVLSGLKKITRDIGKEINDLTSKLIEFNDVVSKSFTSAMLMECLVVCNQLEGKLSEFVKSEV